MTRIAVFIDHNILIRHFIRSGVLRSIEERYDVHYFFPRTYEERVSVDINDLGLKQWHYVALDRRRVGKQRALSRLEGLMRLSNRSGLDKSSMQEFYRWLYDGRRYMGAIFRANRFVYPLYKYLKQLSIGINKKLLEQLSELEIDIIVHPTVLEGLFVNDLIDVGKRSKTPTIFLMNSWDNPATKALMSGIPDMLVVWGQQTQNHSIKYLGIPLERTRIIGAAQFEIYKNSPLISKEQYLERLRISPTKKVVCYAGSSKGLNEVKHLERLEDEIEKRGGLCKIVYKPHPWKKIGMSEREFEQENFEHVVIDPYSVGYYKDRLAGRPIDPDKMKYEHTHILLEAIDGLISPVSTILLEAALFGLPVAVYRSDDDGSAYHLSQARSMVYMTEFYERLDPIVCDDLTNLWPSVSEIIAQSDNTQRRQLIKRESEFFVRFQECRYGDELNQVVQAFLH